MSEFNPKRFETVSNAADRTDAEKAQIIDDLTANLQAFEADRYEKYLQENQSEADFEAAMAQRAEHDAEAENDQKFALEQQVLAEPKLRQMYMMAQQINGLRTKVDTDPSAEFIIADKESKLAELMDTYAADAQADKDMTYTNAEDERRSTKKRMQDEADQALEAKMAALNFIIDQTDTNEAPASIDTESTTPDTPDNKEVEVDTPQNTENPEQEVNQEAAANSSVEQASPAGKDESQEGDQKAQIAETGKTQSSAEKSVDEAEEEPDTYEILGDRMVAGRKLTRVRIQRNTPDGRVVRSVKEFDDEQFEKYFANQGIELPALESEDEPEETSEPAEPEQGQGEPEEEKAEEAPVAQTAPVVVPPVFTTFTGYAETPYTPTSAATPQTPASPTSGPEVTGPVLTGAAAAGPESQGEPSSDELRRQFIDEQVTRYRQADARLRRGYYEQAGQWASYREGTPERNRGEELLRLYREINDNEQYARVWPVVSGEQAGGQKTGLSALWQELGAAWKTDRAEGIMDVVNDKMGPEWSAAPAERRETRKPGRIRRGLGRAGRWLGLIEDTRPERTDAEAADDQAQPDETNVVTTNR